MRDFTDQEFQKIQEELHYEDICIDISYDVLWIMKDNVKDLYPHIMWYAQCVEVGKYAGERNPLYYRLECGGLNPLSVSGETEEEVRNKICQKIMALDNNTPLYCRKPNPMEVTSAVISTKFIEKKLEELKNKEN